MSLNENYVKKIKVHGRACQHCDINKAIVYSNYFSSNFKFLAKNFGHAIAAFLYIPMPLAFVTSHHISVQ